MGSDEWWAGIQDTRDANDEHLAEEERDDVPDLRRYQREHEGAHGLSGADKDPGEFVEKNS